MFKDEPLETRKRLVKAMVVRMSLAYQVNKKDLSALLGVEKNVVSNWGYYARIPWDYLEGCRAATGVSMDWLLYGDQLAPAISANKLAELHQLIVKLFVDGRDFAIITETHPGAAQQLANKLEKDLHQWLGVDASRPETLLLPDN